MGKQSLDSPPGVCSLIRAARLLVPTQGNMSPTGELVLNLLVTNPQYARRLSACDFYSQRARLLHKKTVLLLGFYACWCKMQSKCTHQPRRGRGTERKRRSCATRRIFQLSQSHQIPGNWNSFLSLSIFIQQPTSFSRSTTIRRHHVSFFREF